jgi:hypothetical protein
MTRSAKAKMLQEDQMPTRAMIQKMNWLRWNPDLRGNLKAILLVAIIVSAFAAIVIYYPIFPRKNNPQAGFGPEWDCTAQLSGEPTCIKKRPSR